MKLARWRHAKAEGVAKVSAAVAVIEAQVAADANDGRLLQAVRMEFCLLTCRSFPSRVVKEKKTVSFYDL
jgi:hypothetical protein